MITDHEVRRPGSPHGVPYKTALKLLFLGDRARVTLYLQTPVGIAVDHWDGRTAVFSRAILSGENPFRVTDSVELVNLEWKTESGDATNRTEANHTLSVSCISSNVHDTSGDERLVEKLRNWFGRRRMEIKIGSSPFYGDLLYLLHMVPAQGWHIAPAGEASMEVRTITIE